MKLCPIVVRLVAAAFVAIIAPIVHAQDGLQGALSQANQPLRINFAGPSERRIAAADFDNDHRPDGAVLFDSGSLQNRNAYRIELHLSATDNTELRFESAENALSIAAWDINHDGATDVIVEHAFTHRRIFVWLGDGRGGFRKGRVEDFPSTTALGGDQAGTPSPHTDRNVLSLPSQSRFERILLKASHISGRPPSTVQFDFTLRISRRPLYVAGHLGSRAPPLSESL